MLHTHYKDHYSGRANSLSQSTDDSIQPTSRNSPSKVNFTLRYKKKDITSHDELEEYFDQKREDFESCEPLEWWVRRRAQFPNLYCLARDIFSIPGTLSFGFLCDLECSHYSSPGSAVAVERIFSGGRDTISLRRASLQPGTIRTLMTLKQHLRLARNSLSILS